MPPIPLPRRSKGDDVGAAGGANIDGEVVSFLKEFKYSNSQLTKNRCRCWCRSRWWWGCIKNTGQCWLRNWRSNGLWRTKNVTNQSRC